MVKFLAITLLSFVGLAGLTLVKADTPLELSMQKMGKAYKQLSLDLKQPLAANKADYLALAGTMKTEAQTSRDLVPKKAAALPADQQATMVDAYQKGIDELIGSIDALSAAIQGSQWPEATKQMGVIKQEMFAGHKEFRKKDK
jgi:soluble cytochrome b562